MQTTTDVATAMRAEILARLVHECTAEVDGGRTFDHAERVARAVATNTQRAIAWLHQILTGEGVTRDQLIGLGFNSGVVDAARTLSMRDGESVSDYAKRVAACNDSNVLAVAVVHPHE